MGWAIAYDENWGRDIGYGVPALCDHPDCDVEIDRGLSYVCANQEPRGGDGCGLYFCDKHLYMNYEAGFCCKRCDEGLAPFTPKPDLPMWTLFKMVDSSWKKWRESEGHPEPSPANIQKMQDYYK